MKAFRENPNAFLEKHKQQLAFELKEEGFRLKDIFIVVGIPEATYHYHVKNFRKEDPDKERKELITDLFKKFHEGIWL